MAHQHRSLPALVMLAVLFLLAGCGDGVDNAPQAGNAETSPTAQRSASPDAPKPDRLTG
jgi:hypothetical protein